MAGRRTTKTRADRIDDLQKAINRSGLMYVELMQMLVDWYGNEVTLHFVGRDMRVTKSACGDKKEAERG